MFKKLIPLLFLFAGFQANAAPISITMAAFDGTEDVIGFNGIIDDTVITNQLAGASFSNLWGRGNNARNFDLGCTLNPSGGCDAVTIDFDMTVSMFGIDMLTNDGTSSFQLSFFSGATLINNGFFTVATNTSFSFYGFQDLVNGFDRVVIDAGNTSNRAMIVDNLRFNLASAPVPEPSIIALFGLGLVGLGFARRRQS
jgi:hypothetical protein